MPSTKKDHQGGKLKTSRRRVPAGGVFGNGGQKALFWLFFFVYLALLCWIILFKAGPIRLDARQVGAAAPVYLGLYFNPRDALLNFLIFLPFGMYLALLKPGWSFLVKALLPFLLSLLFESTQFLLSIGTADLMDLLTNTLGAVLGLAFYPVAQKAHHHRAPLLYALFAILMTLLMLVGARRFL